MGKKKRSGARTPGNPANREPTAQDLYGRAQPSGVADPRKLGGDIAGPGGPRDRNAVVIDATDAVLMDGVTVAVIETYSAGKNVGQRIFATIDGRINKTTDRARIGLMFDSDGAAALITELLAVADRYGAQMLADLSERFAALQREGNVDLGFLRAAIDQAIEAGQPPTP